MESTALDLTKKNQPQPGRKKMLLDSLWLLLKIYSTEFFTVLAGRKSSHPVPCGCHGGGGFVGATWGAV